MGGGFSVSSRGWRRFSVAGLYQGFPEGLCTLSPKPLKPLYPKTVYPGFRELGCRAVPEGEAPGLGMFDVLGVQRLESSDRGV